MDRLKGLLEKLKILIPHGFRIFQDNKMSIYSGHSTLFIVTAVFPCVVLILSIVNLLPGFSTKDVVDILFQILPDLGPIKDLILSMMVDLKDQSGGLLASAAAVTTLWAASKGVNAIQKGLDQLDEEPEEPQKLALETEQPDLPEENPEEDQPKKKLNIKALLPKAKDLAKGILKRLLFTLMVIILIPALLLIEMLGDSLSKVICSSVKKVDPGVLNSTLSNIDSFFHISSLVVMAFALLVILQIYALLPAKRRTLKSQLPGAFLTGICWYLFTELFSFFIPRFYHASNLYGSLASLFLLLLWLRFIVMILFAGGVLNHTLEEERLAAEAAGGDSDESDEDADETD